MNPVKVLILDDSVLMRETLHRELSRDAGIEVVAKASDPYDARDKIVEFRPDIMISDIIMERMDGIEFIKTLLPQHYLPVIMISVDPRKKTVAEEAGARLFVAKPESGACRFDEFIANIVTGIKSIASGEESKFTAQQLCRGLIVIGASTGGAEAIEVILRDLPAVMPPIVVAQHMPPNFTKSFAGRLNTICGLSVKETSNGEPLLPGQAYIAPGGYHTTVRERDNRFYVSCSENTQGIKTCPSVDFLFNSAAPFGDRVIGAILTGMGKDGAQGLKEMSDAGCVTIGQNKETSVVYGMPKSAYDLGAVQHCLPLRRIAPAIVELALSNYPDERKDI